MFNTRAHLADRGGMVPHGEAALNLSGHAERYLSNRQNMALERLVEYAVSAGYGSGQGPVMSPEQWSGRVAGGDGGEFTITSGVLEVRDDGMVRIVDARLRRVGTSISNGRRA